MIFWTLSVHSLRYSFCNEFGLKLTVLNYRDKSLSQLRDDHHLAELLPIEMPNETVKATKKSLFA